MHFKQNAPQEWQSHWASIPNSVRALYGTFKRTGFPWTTKEVEIEAWGQLCFDDAAARACAYHMWNHEMRTGWKFVSWRCVMDREPVGGKLSGVAPADFSFEKYGLPRR